MADSNNDEPESIKKNRNPKIRKLSFNDLSVEIRHNIIVHSLNDEDAWSSNENHKNLSLVDRSMHAHLNDVKAITDYKKNLDASQFVSRVVLAKTFQDDKFTSSIAPMLDSRDIGLETGALAPSLTFMSPELRSTIFQKISEHQWTSQMIGYSRIAARADLFKADESDQMFRSALEIFERDDVSDFIRYRAADTLTAGSEWLGDEIRSELKETVASDPKKRTIFAESVVNMNPSLLKDEEINSMVREQFRSFERPHSGILALASHIDKTRQSDVDFIVYNSLLIFNSDSVDGNHDAYAAAAIAQVADGNLGDGFRKRIEALKQTDSEAGRQLKSAFEALQRSAPSASTDTVLPTRPPAIAAQNQILKIVRLPDFEEPEDVLRVVKDVAESQEKQMNSARKALMDTIRETRER